MNPIPTAPDSNPPWPATVIGQVGRWLETRCKNENFFKELEWRAVRNAGAIIARYSWGALPRPNPINVFYDAVKELLICESEGRSIGKAIEWDGDAAAIETAFLRLVDRWMHREVRNPRRTKENIETVPMSEEVVCQLDMAVAKLKAPNPAPEETAALANHFYAQFLDRLPNDFVRDVARALSAGEIDDKAGSNGRFAERHGVPNYAVSKAKTHIRGLLETMEHELLQNPDHAPLCS